METIEYHTMDKSEWGDGPWMTEPDKVQYVDEATGLPCLIVRNRMGSLCGYVGVSEGHPAFEKPYSDYEEGLLDHIKVHGGLTFSDMCHEGPEDSSICHIPAPGEPDHVWWLGFDCGRAWDIAPEIQAYYNKKYQETGDPLYKDLYDSYGTYRDIDYVRNEIASLAQQLKAMEV